MEALKFDLEIPFWCSFSDFSSLNIKLSYPCPPISTIFGLIQNALGKISLHCIDNSKVSKKIEKQYITDFNNLKFAIIIKNSGELIEDYLNIHKGNRKDSYERDLENNLKQLIKDHPYEKEIKKNIKKISKYSFFTKLNLNENNEILDDIIEYDRFIIEFIKNYWNSPIIEFNYNKTWLSTQINKQRLINPYFSIYLISEDKTGEFSLENIKKYLINPKRPLYIGESDDIVIINNVSIVDIEKNVSSKVDSIVPGIHQNSNLIKLPINIKFDTSKDNFTLCSIPNGDLNSPIECYEYDGENFVFL